jgi:hypothetical protein
VVGGEGVAGVTGLLGEQDVVAGTRLADLEAVDHAVHVVRRLAVVADRVLRAGGDLGLGDQGRRGLAAPQVHPPVQQVVPVTALHQDVQLVPDQAFRADHLTRVHQAAEQPVAAGVVSAVAGYPELGDRVAHGDRHRDAGAERDVAEGALGPGEVVSQGLGPAGRVVHVAVGRRAVRPDRVRACRGGDRALEGPGAATLQRALVEHAPQLEIIGGARLHEPVGEHHRLQLAVVPRGEEPRVASGVVHQPELLAVVDVADVAFAAAQSHHLVGPAVAEQDVAPAARVVEQDVDGARLSHDEAAGSAAEVRTGLAEPDGEVGVRPVHRIGGGRKRGRGGLVAGAGGIAVACGEGDRGGHEQGNLSHRLSSFRERAWEWLPGGKSSGTGLEYLCPRWIRA